MTLATDLAEAAGQSFDNLHIRWLSNQLLSNLVGFCRQSLPIFPQQLPGSNPVSNWITVLWAIADKFPATDVPIDQLTQAANLVYRLCWMAFSVIGTNTNTSITTAQASALLVKYNTFIGF